MDEFEEIYQFAQNFIDTKKENILLKEQIKNLEQAPKLKTDLCIWGITDASNFIGCARNTLRDILKKKKYLKVGIDYLTNGKNYYVFSKSSLQQLKKDIYEKKTKTNK